MPLKPKTVVCFLKSRFCQAVGMIIEPLSVGDTVVSHFLFITDNTCKSRFITAFVTYHSASVIIRNTFDWNQSCSMEQSFSRI